MTVLICHCQGKSERGQVPSPPHLAQLRSGVSQLSSEVTPVSRRIGQRPPPHSFQQPHSFLGPHESPSFVPRTVPCRVNRTRHSCTRLPSQTPQLLSFGKEGAGSRRHLLQCACYHGFVKRSHVCLFSQLFRQCSHSCMN